MARPKQYVIIGGGIAGVTAAEELLDRMEDGSAEVTLLTATGVVKQVGKVVQVTRKLEEMEVVERDASEYGQNRRHLKVIQAYVKGIDTIKRVVRCKGDIEVAFDRCLICTGAAPKLISKHPNVVGIRDTESIQDLSRRLQSARRVLVLGNGGIALEIVHEITNCELIWAIKDAYVGNTFFDHTASEFVLPELEKRRELRVVDRDTGMDAAPGSSNGKNKRPRPSSSSSSSSSLDNTSMSAAAAAAAEGPQAQERQNGSISSTGDMKVGEGFGGALGPDWKETFANAKMEGQAGERGGGGPSASSSSSSKPLTIIFRSELKELIEPADSQERLQHLVADEMADGKEWPLYVRLTNEQTYGCDFVVSATGIVPLVDMLGPEFERGEDGGVVVNELMQTTASKDVYAAGDCCSITWPESDVWFQMRLWTQARTMAQYAAKCMADQVDELGSGFAFELFAHMTKFFGFKVALLGCFNAQLLRDEDQQRLVREIKVSSKKKAPSLVAAEGEGGRKGGDDVHDDDEVEIHAPVLTTRPEAIGTEEPKGKDSSSSKVEILTRLTPGVEYIKVVVVEGRVKGAMLVGEGTELAETFENLILNQIDVSPYSVDLLDPDIDIDDYFD